MRCSAYGGRPHTSASLQKKEAQLRGCSRRASASRRCALSVRARSGPPGGQSRLIIPGGGNDSQRDGQQSRLVLPGQERRHGSSIDTNGVPAPSTSQFRPPPGFMDTDPKTLADQPLDHAEARNALERLRAGGGEWHELAKLFPRLSAAGYDSAAVELESGIERALQSIWAVGAQVYDSLKKAGKMSEEKLAYFDSDTEGPNMLYHMRFLPVAARPAVAEYIVDQQLDSTESAVLARAVKEQERRDGSKEGFTTSPADCLAYKYYRDAIETRNEVTRAQLIQKGLSTADTDSACTALEELLESKPESIIKSDREDEVQLEVIRMTGDEVEFRPLPLVGEMAETSASAVTAAVSVRQKGVYNSFTVEPEAAGQEFVALPAFRSLLLSKSPVALSLSDCSTEPAIMKAARAKTKEEIERQSGPGLVVIDRNTEGEGTDPAAFYVRERGPGCEMVQGDALAASEASLGRVIFICRPPARDAKAKLDSYALMSL